MCTLLKAYLLYLQFTVWSNKYWNWNEAASESIGLVEHGSTVDWDPNSGLSGSEYSNGFNQWNGFSHLGLGHWNNENWIIKEIGQMPTRPMKKQSSPLDKFYYINNFLVYTIVLLFCLWPILGGVKHGSTVMVDQDPSSEYSNGFSLRNLGYWNNKVNSYNYNYCFRLCKQRVLVNGSMTTKETLWYGIDNRWRQINVKGSAIFIL